MGRKLGALPPLGEGELGPHLLTHCGQGMPTFILIRPTVWPQYTNITDRTGQTGQRSDSIGRTQTVLQTVTQKMHHACKQLGKNQPQVNNVWYVTSSGILTANYKSANLTCKLWPHYVLKATKSTGSTMRMGNWCTVRGLAFFNVVWRGRQTDNHLSHISSGFCALKITKTGPFWTQILKKGMGCIWRCSINNTIN